jgi:hypothetical protein
MHGVPEEMLDLGDNLIILTVFNHYILLCIQFLARMGEGRGVYRILVGKPEGKRPLGRPRCRWEDNIKMDL